MNGKKIRSIRMINEEDFLKNYPEVAEKVLQEGAVVILKDERPKFVYLDFDKFLVMASIFFREVDALEAAAEAGRRHQADGKA
jgi:hypothetical protein